MAGIGAMEIIALLSGITQGAGNSIAAAGQGKRAMQQHRETLAAQKDTRNQATALTESGMNPFRQQLHQARSVADLDVLERASYNPVKLTPAAPYAGMAPQMSGGLNYTKSPELVRSAAALKANVMGGNTAPTMTDPKNFGKTATLDLVRLGANGADPSAVNAAQQRPSDVNSYMAGQDRRMAGRAFTAETRGTDFSADQARQILGQAIQAEWGRTPQPGEVDMMLAGQGLQPGGRWVGEAGLRSILDTIRQQAAPRPSYSGRA